MSVAQINVDYVHSPEELISRHLKENGQKTQWLADKVGYSRQYIQRILRGKGSNKKPLTPEIRQKINHVLKTNY